MMALAVGLMPAACATDREVLSVRELFDGIQIGLARSEVEARLGPPVSRSAIGAAPLAGEEAWYLPAPALEAFESPYAPGTIGVTYGPDGCVVEKRLNPQYRDR